MFVNTYIWREMFFCFNFVYLKKILTLIIKRSCLLCSVLVLTPDLSRCN